MVNTEKYILSFYKLGRQFIHNIHLTDEVYEKDYEDVRNKRFKSAKLAIEYEVRFYFVLQEPAPNVNTTKYKYPNALKQMLFYFYFSGMSCT